MVKAQVLVLVQGYPDEHNRYNMAYVHSRLLGYQQAGLNVTVLSFSASTDYVFEGISVVTEKSCLKHASHNTLLIAHAPNLRNHMRFLLLYGHRFSHRFFFFHGHEVLEKRLYYPEPYAYMPQAHTLYQTLDRVYDKAKLRILRRLISRWLQQKRLHLIFVSEWMLNAFVENVQLSRNEIMPFSQVIPNAVHPAFLQKQWRADGPFQADVITIRPLDNSKYAIDQVLGFAHQFPELSFHVFGKGKYFIHHPPPPNLIWEDAFLKPEDIVRKLKNYRAALMPTRLDAQGVMMCELASSGIPLMTSDLPICREMLKDFHRVYFLNGQNDPLPEIIEQLCQLPPPSKQPFDSDTLIAAEVQLLLSVIN